jgi:hypothetical protein
LRLSFRGRVVQIVVAGAIALGAVGSAQAQQSRLMANTANVDAATLSSNGQTELNKLKANRRNLRVTAKHLDVRVFSGNIVSVDVGGTTIRLVKQFTTVEADGSTTWAGQQDAYNSAVFSIKDGKVFGTINTRNGTFQIQPVEGDTHAILELDMSQQQPKDESEDIPDGHGYQGSTPELQPQGGIATQSLSTAATVANPPVRILVAYSAHAAAALGNQLSSQITQAIAQINQANVNSNVTFRAVLAGTIQVNYMGPYTASAALAAFRVMPDVLAAHDSMQADLMVMLEAIPDSAEAGLSAGINVTAANAFSVVSTTYMTSNLSFAHEVGHLMGADHPQPDTPNNVFRFGHGYWRWSLYSILSPAAQCAHTIMAYAISQSNGVQPSVNGILPQCAPDPRISYWSSPTVWANTGSGSSVIMGATGTNDNAQVLNITGPVVTNFHSTVLGSKSGIGAPNCSTNPRLCS